MQLKWKGLALAVSLVASTAACSKKPEEPKTQAPAVKAEAPKPNVPAVAYVSHQDGPITVYSVGDYTKLGDIHVGEGARGVGLSDDGSLLVVAVKSSSDLAIVDTATRQVVKRVPVGKNPEFVRVLGDLAFVAYEPSSEGGPPPKPGSKEAKARENAKKDDDDDKPAQIAVIDLKKGEKIKEITAGMETEGIEFSGDGKNIIVTNEADENVSVHNIETGELVKRIDTKEYGIRPRGVKRAPDGKHYAVTLEYGNKLLKLDKDFNVVDTTPTGEVPYGVTYSRDGKEILVALARGKIIQVFDAETLNLKREMPVGDRCWHFSYTPDDSQLVVACGRSREIQVLNAQTGEKVKSITEGDMPWGVIMSPKSVGTLDMPSN
ncbi:MAG TPA: cytochrome D1 domain-containing protein [Limnobacter sp.]|uniref:cytochrome D1 domain-containing protein n=1 Tax=Limnobacter sp. TaxID=2003368 RepID=UPI002EDA58DE